MLHILIVRNELIQKLRCFNKILTCPRAIFQYRSAKFIDIQKLRINILLMPINILVLVLHGIQQFPRLRKIGTLSIRRKITQKMALLS